MERAVHDRGGWPTSEPIDRTEHELEDWELLTDALRGALAQAGLMNVDELRRGIESMPSADYERAGYYERWLFSIETILTEKGILAPGEGREDLSGRSFASSCPVNTTPVGFQDGDRASTNAAGPGSCAEP